MTTTTRKKTTAKKTAVKDSLRTVKLSELIGGLETRAPLKLKVSDETCKSMDQSGLIMPPIVRKVGAKFQVVCGYRRWGYAELLEWDSITVLVRECPDSQLTVTRALENMHRVGNTVPEKAELLYKEHKTHGTSSAEMARVLGVSPNHPANMIRAWSKLNPTQRASWLLKPSLFSIKALMVAGPVKDPNAPKEKPLRSKKAVKDLMADLTAIEQRSEAEAVFLAALEWVDQSSNWTPLDYDGDGSDAAVPSPEDS